MPLTDEQIKMLRAMKPRAHRHGHLLAFTAPTWCMRTSPNLTLDAFLPDLAHPTRGSIAWRDFANMPSHTLRPFFASPDILDTSATDDSLSPEPLVVWDPNANDFQVSPLFKPLPGRDYSLAADLSVSGDSTGLACSHIEPDGNVVLDFSLKIKAHPRVDYRPIEAFFVYLRDKLGFTILGISFDQFQSHRTIEELKEKGFDAKVVHYADTFAGCSTISDLIHSGYFKYRLNADKDFIGEAKELQSINDKRIDHLQSGGIYNSKDVWDAVTNSVVRALEAGKVAGIRLSPDDIHTTNVEELFTDLILKKQNPGALKDFKTNYVQFAHLYTRLSQDKDPNVLTVTHVARNLDSNEIIVLDTWRRHVPLQGQVEFLLKLQEAWRPLPIKSTLPGSVCEVTSESSEDAEALSDAFQQGGSDMMITSIKDHLTPVARIEATKELVQNGIVRFPQDWENNHEMGRLIRRLMSHPYVPDDYELQAFGGAVANAQELEAVATSTSEAKSEDKKSQTGGSGKRFNIENW